MGIVYILSVFSILAFFLLLVKTNFWYNPTGFIVLLMSLTLIISNFSFTGIFVPTIKTQLIFLIFMIGILFGGLLAYPTSFNHHVIVEENKSKVILLLLLICMPLIGFVFLKALAIIRSEGYLSYIFRTRGTEGGEALLFGAGYFRMVINYMVIPIIYSGLFIGAALFFLKNQKRIFLISILLLATYTFILSARDGFLLIILILGYSYLLIRKEKKIELISKSVQYFFRGILLLILSFAIYITAFRAKSSFTVLDTLAHYGISYHTLGFTMFDVSLNDRNSYLNNTLTLGRASFGFPDQLLEILSRRIDSEGVRSVSRNLIREMDKPTLVGFQSWRPDGLYYANAFFTVLYPLYLDLRLPGVIIGGFLYGFLLTRYFISWKMNPHNIYAFSMLLILFYMGYNFLFMPIIVRNIFWPFLFFTLIILKVRFPAIKIRLKE
jgi:oligosaccharide repeat unit polymerase